MSENTPKRSDQVYIASLQKSVINTRVAMIAFAIIIILLIAVVFSQLNAPKNIAIVDTSSGKTFGSKIYQVDTPIELIEQQLIYYSRQYIESFLSSDYITIKSDRDLAWMLMHPSVRKEVGEKFIEDLEIEKLRAAQQSSIFKWSIKPVMVASEDPRFSVFCQFERRTKTPGYEDKVEKFNIKLDWGRLKKNFDPFERPHGLVLIKFNALQSDDSQIKEFLNKVK